VRNTVERQRHKFFVAQADFLGKADPGCPIGMFHLEHSHPIQRPQYTEHIGEPMAKRKAQPPQHGQITVTTMKIEHARKHLAQMTQGAEEVRSYGGHDATGVSSQGALSPGGASVADYSTGSVGDTPDADSAGPTGY
jgi:hypothetical protein